MYITDCSKAVVPVLVLLFVAVVYSTRRFVLCLTLFSFVLVFFSPFSIAIILLWEERANLSAFRTFVRFVLVWFCWFPLPLGVREVLRFLIVAFPGLFSYLCFSSSKHHYMPLHYLNTQTDNLLSHFFFFLKKKNKKKKLFLSTDAQVVSVLVVRI